MLTRKAKKAKKVMSKSQENVDTSKNLNDSGAHGQADTTPTNKEIWTLLLEIQGNTARLLADNEEQRQQYNELKTALEFETEKREELEERVTCLEKKLQDAVSSLETAEGKVKEEERKLDDLEQYTRKYNLEISGAARDGNMSDKEIVLAIANELDVEITERDLDIVHRLPVKKGNPSIIIRFKSYTAKQKLYKAKKYLRNKDWSRVFGYSTSIYFNENLTKRRGKLFKEVRDVVKSKKFYGSWTIDGKIFLKKNSEASPVQIKEFEDINKL